MDHARAAAGPVSWVLDLDGVVWLGTQAIAGASDAVAALRRRGHKLAFVTNNAQASRGEVAARLSALGIEADNDVFTSAMAAASLVAPGQRVLAFAGPGVHDALASRGVEVVTGPTADVVIVGKHEDLSYQLLRNAARAVRAGATFIATNTDATYPTADGLDPGAGSLVAAVATAAGRAPDVVAGKPHQAMVDLVVGHLGGNGVVVGDVPHTDGLFAKALGYHFALVLSGVTTVGDLPVDPEPQGVFVDLADAVEQLGS